MTSRSQVFAPPRAGRAPDNRTVVARIRPDLAPLPPVAHTGLIACYGPLAWLAMRLREGETPTETRMFRAAIWARLDEARDRAQDQGLPADEVEDADFVLVAMLDSAALSRPGELRDLWSGNTLEAQRYKASVAGHRFFETLQRRLRHGGSSDLLELYYLALVSGFQGELGGRPQEIQQLVGELQRQLAARPVPEQLSGRTAVDLPPPPPEPSLPSPWALLSVGFAFVVVFGLAMAIFVYVQAHDVGELATALAVALRGSP